MAIEFQRATRTQARLKIAISGPSGSGKTRGALALARVLAGADGKIALIDTENGSASLYADDFEFDTMSLGPPFLSARYLEAMEAAREAGYTVLVIDSLSHQWNGEGGILARKEDVDKRGGNQWTNWREFTKEHTGFVSSVLQMPCHVICTLRSKQEYVMEENSRGKSQPKKVGTAPVQREGLEYEFSIVFDVQMDHKAAASKDRTKLFADKLVDLTDKKVGGAIVKWIASGAPLAPPTPDPDPQVVGAIQPTSSETGPVATTSTQPDHGSLAWAAALPLMGKDTASWSGHGRKPIGEVPDGVLKQARNFFSSKVREQPEGRTSERMRAQVEAIDVVMDDRALNSDQVALPLAAASAEGEQRPDPTAPSSTPPSAPAATTASQASSESPTPTPDDDLPF